MLRLGRARPERGISTLEVLVAVVLIALVVVFTWRIIGTTLALLGSGNQGFQRAARVRTQATAWVQAVSEFTRSQGFSAVPVGEYWIPTAPGPYAPGPALPSGFQCGRVRVSDWDGGGPVTTDELRLVTIEIYRTVPTCGTGGPGATPFVVAQTGIAPRQ